MEAALALIKRYPRLCKHKNKLDEYPLHKACGTHNASEEVISLLLRQYSDACAQQNDKHEGPLQILVRGLPTKRITAGTFQTLLQQWHEIAIKFYGIELAATRHQCASQGAFARANLDNMIIPCRVNRTANTINNAGVLKEVLTKTFTSAVPLMGVVHCGVTASASNGVAP